MKKKAHHQHIAHMSKRIFTVATLAAVLAVTNYVSAQQHTGKTDKQIIEDTKRNSEEARRAREEAAKQAERERIQKNLEAEARDKAAADAAWREKQRKLEEEKRKQK